MSNKKTTILYERLSRDDELQGPSNSIQNQERQLEEYAEQNNLKPYIHIQDDGWSGTVWNRPGWMELIEKVEADEVGAIVLKDSSRMGRDYLRVGLYREMFREKGIRLIAINDNVDTANGDDDFTPFREIMAEWYVRDTSRKIKSAFHTRGMAGKHTSSYPPFGYLKSSEDKNQWIVDEEGAAIVRRIFQLTLEGKGPYQICNILSDDKVEIPGYYLAQRGVGLHQKHTFADPYRWSSSTVCGILKKKEYLGHTVNFKTRKNSYKDKKNKYVSENEWVIFENTHEPIIDQVTFDNVQRIRGGVKRRPDGWGYVHPLTGLLYCDDCGGKLYVHRINNGKDIPKYVCGNYTKYISKKNGKVASGVLCQSPHRIDAGTVLNLISETLNAIVKYAKDDKTSFVKSVKETLSAKQVKDVKAQKKRLTVCKRRTADIEILLLKSYEDNALGKLPDKRYNVLCTQYEKEQSELEREISVLREAVDGFESGSERAKHFMELVKRYEDFDNLTTVMLNEFVEKIIVHERTCKGRVDTTQTVEIHLNFIGQYTAPKEEIDPAILAEQEEERRKREATKDRLHRNYLKRKANGKQKEYERRYEEKRKARMIEKKAALFADGVVLGADSALPASANQ